MRRSNDYTPFYKSLKLDFSDVDLTSKEQLRIMMRDYKYRVKKDKSTNEIYKAFPTEKQLEIAWTYITKGQEVIESYEYKVYTISKNGRYRANKNLVIDNKIYKKGWFIPKRDRY